jgi:hypothetical protein
MGGGWRPHPDAVTGPTTLGPVEPAPVVGIGALCDLQSAGDRSRSFAVSEFLTLADGRRVVLHEERGFTISGTWAGETAESLTQDVLTTVLPDELPGEEPVEDHPYPWLADLARARGLSVTADDLRALPYRVVLTDAVLRRLA